VKDWLVKSGGIGANRLSAKGFGKTKPVAPNAKPDGSDDPEGRQKNRRVEIRVRKA
jgi:outer membrane protein OmpA-like peptidoglycan-associated protein